MPEESASDARTARKGRNSSQTRQSRCVSRRTLILVPGLGDDDYLWTDQVRALADLTRLVVRVFDHQTRVDEMAAALLAGAPPRFALAGFSMGGRVALEVMRRAPGRVERLALVSSSARAGRHTIASPYEGSLETIITAEFIGVLHENARREPALVRGVTDMVRRRGAAGLSRQQQAIMASEGHLDILAAIDCPTLVVCGRDDPVTPTERSREIARAIPGAVLHVIDRCGHYVPLEHPQTLSALMRVWLETGNGDRDRIGADPAGERE